MRMHPIQLDYSRSKDQQACNLCGAAEQWSQTGKAHAEKSLSQVAQWNTLHLVHLVRDHLPDVQATFSPAGRAAELDLSETDIRKRVSAV